MTKKIKFFKSLTKTKRFNKNQKVWISMECANHIYVVFKYRGRGRYVSGIVDKFAKCVAEIKTIEVSETFAHFIASHKL